ncbi:MAG: hypothetical protein AAF682_24120 [Planctomycetota bacterium]
MQGQWQERMSLMEGIQASFGSPSFWFKVLVLVVLWPFWLPVVKAVYRELQDALRGEGGIFAKDYTKRDLKRLEERFGIYEGPLHSIPKEPRHGRGRGRGMSGGQGRSAGASRGGAGAGRAKGGGARSDRAQGGSRGGRTTRVSSGQRRGF